MLELKIKGLKGINIYGNEYDSFTLEAETVLENDRVFNCLLVNLDNFEALRGSECIYNSRDYFGKIQDVLAYRNYCVAMLKAEKINCKLDEIVYWYS